MKDKFIGSQKETWMEKVTLNDNVSDKISSEGLGRLTFDLCQEGLQENFKLRFLNIFN